MKLINVSLLFMAISAAQAAESIVNPLTAFTGHSQSNSPNQPTTLNGSELNVSFVWSGGSNAYERIDFNGLGATFGGNAPVGGASHLGRNYIRTNESNFSDGSFRAYVTVNRPTRQAVFFGMGTGALGHLKQPDINTGNASVFLELQEGFDNASRRLAGGTSAIPTNVQVGYEGMINVTGLMRLRMDYNAVSKTVAYAIDYHPSGEFVADQTFPSVRVSSASTEWENGENSCIYFGGQRNVVFTDFVVDTGGIPFASDMGRLTREVWNNLPGHTVSSFTDSSRYLQSADSINSISGASVPQNIGNSYASRIRGYITAPLTGAYSFWIASDDQSILYLSPTDSKFGRAKIASVSNWVNPLEWDIMPSQKSSSIQLIAGQRYFLEALHKESGSNDHLAIAWQVPGGSREVIPASALESFTVDSNDLDDDELPDDWEIAHGFSIAAPSTTPSNQLATADFDQDGYTNLEEAAYDLNPNIHGGVCGALLLETWNSLIGINVATLTKSSKFAGVADQTEFVFSSEIPANRANSFGARMRGYLIAPATGSYTFHIAGDDQCELWLSPSSSQFAKQKVASVPSHSGVRQWNLYPEQTSAPVTLLEGQKYYLEALIKEASGEDHLAIGWKVPSSSAITIIPGTDLESYAYDLEDPDGDNMPSAWETANGLNPAVNDAALDPDLDGLHNLYEFQSGTNPQTKEASGLTVELWTNIAEYSTLALVENANFYSPAQAVAIQQSSTTGEQSNPSLNFATRSRGYLVAPQTGPYRFWISGRNGVELYLSTDNTKYAKRRIAEINPEIGGGHGIGFNDLNYWDQFSSQQSAVIHLEEGQRYFIETLQVNGHVSGSHVSLAWAPPGEDRVPIPSGDLLPYATEVTDGDDDYLPDDWESQNGLDPFDNGHTEMAKQGERGDFDSDGLSNREEYLLNTNPSAWDTDGDGESDGDEVQALGSDPRLANSVTDTFLSEVDLTGFESISNGWLLTDGGLLPDSFRGEVRLNFTVPTDGYWVLRLQMEVMGTTYSEEIIPVEVKVDGIPATRRDVKFGSSKLGVLPVLSPWLTAGSHHVSILIDNEIAHRTVRLVAVKIYAPASASAVLERDNRLIEHPENTRTSPAFIEGYARNVSSVTVNGSPVLNGTGGGHWFANVPLANDSTPQTYGLSYEQGWAVTGVITWQTTNVMNAETLIIRQGDSLRVGAWGADLSQTSNITLSTGSSWSLTGNQATIVPFNNPGIFTLSGILQNGETANLLVHVIAAPEFSLASVDVLENSVRTLSVMAAAEIEFSSSESLGVELASLRSGANTNVKILTNSADVFGIAARLPGRGAILSVQPINTICISDALQNDLSIATDSAIAGYKTVSTPLTILNLPSGGRVDVSIVRSGVMFPNGTTLKSIRPLDIINGAVNLEFLYPLGQAGGYCHALFVYDRNGVLIGTR